MDLIPSHQGLRHAGAPVGTWQTACSLGIAGVTRTQGASCPNFLVDKNEEQRPRQGEWPALRRHADYLLTDYKDTGIYIVFYL